MVNMRTTTVALLLRLFDIYILTKIPIMPRPTKLKMLEHFKGNGQLEEVISFKFDFSNKGSYSAWEVWCNGKERATHKNSGSFGGSISPGSVLKVEFKIWNGSYEITYGCKSGSAKKDDSHNPSPIKGQAMGPAVKKEIVTIQF